MNRMRSLAWSGVEASASGAFSLVSAFIIARLIGPAEMGLGAAVASVHVLLWVGVNALFADAIVQRPTMSEADAASALWASALVGLIAALVQAGMSWPLHAAMEDGRVGAMSLALAAPLPLVGAAGVVQGRVTRARDYRLLALRALVGQGTGTVIGVATAVREGGAWAVVAQQATISFTGALVLLGGARWRPRLTWHWEPVRALLRLGVPLTASTLVLHGRYRLFALLVGGTAGPAALGQVHMAFRLVDAIRELVSTAMWRLMLPSMSEHQADQRALLRQIDRALGLIGLTLFPLCGAMLAGIAPLTRLLLGPSWAPSGTAALPLVALAVWLFLQFPSGVACVARGAPQYVLRANLASTVILVLGVALLRPATPVSAACVWLAAQGLLAPYVLATTARVLGTSLFRPFRAGMQALAATSVAAASAILLPSLAGVSTELGTIAARAAIVLGALGALVAIRRVPPGSPARS
ncbi:MAG TPA: oligosaccharide flippase family protein [Acetobacteraceae bacterium]|nr:oligosaccharide flippase family protein [Acetobacteraceae bacterium]